MIRWNFLCLYFDGLKKKKKSVPHVLGTTEKNLPPSTSFPLSFVQIDKALLGLLLSRLNRASSQSVFMQQIFQSCNDLCGPLLDLLQ